MKRPTARQTVKQAIDSMKPESKVCSICHATYTGWGNNAEPVNDGRCCDSCNQLVIAARIQRIQRSMKP